MEKRKTVFIIDDGVDLCLLMKAYFLRKNYEVYIAHTFYDAFQRVEVYQPEIIFLSTAACRNPDENIKQLKEAVPAAEIIVDKFDIPLDAWPGYLKKNIHNLPSSITERTRVRRNESW